MFCYCCCWVLCVLRTLIIITTDKKKIDDSLNLVDYFVFLGFVLKTIMKFSETIYISIDKNQIIFQWKVCWILLIRTDWSIQPTYRLKLNIEEIIDSIFIPDFKSKNEKKKKKIAHTEALFWISSDHDRQFMVFMGSFETHLRHLNIHRDIGSNSN